MKVKSDHLFTKEMDRLDMNVSEAAHALLEPGWSYAADHPTFTRIYCVLSGQGVIHCDNRSLPLESGNIYIMPAGMRFSYQIHTPMDKLYFHINMLRYSKYDMLQCVQDCIVLPHREQEIEQAASLLESSSEILSALQLKTWLYALLLEGLQAVGGQPGQIEEYSSLVKNAIRYVEENRRSGMTTAEVAAALFVSDSRLQKAFRQEVGVPLGRYMSDRLLFIAEQLLRLTKRTIKDISDELGFCDPFYFSRVFSSRYGVSPSVYRKNLYRE